MAAKRRVEKSKSCRVSKTGARGGGLGVRAEKEKLLPRIGGTREEIQRTPVETMQGILSGRIAPRRAYAIGRLCRVQLRLLEVLERESKLKRLRVEKSKEVKGRKPWVN